MCGRILEGKEISVVMQLFYNVCFLIFPFFFLLSSYLHSFLLLPFTFFLSLFSFLTFLPHKHPQFLFPSFHSVLPPHSLHQYLSLFPSLILTFPPFFFAPSLPITPSVSVSSGPPSPSPPLPFPSDPHPSLHTTAGSGCGGVHP